MPIKIFLMKSYLLTKFYYLNIYLLKFETGLLVNASL